MVETMEDGSDWLWVMKHTNFACPSSMFETMWEGAGVKFTVKHTAESLRFL